MRVNMLSSWGYPFNELPKDKFLAKLHVGGNMRYRRGERPLVPTRSHFQPICVLHMPCCLFLIRAKEHVNQWLAPMKRETVR